MGIMDSMMGGRLPYYSLRLQDVLQLTVPSPRTELGKKAFKYAVPSGWNTLQKDLKVSELTSFDAFGSLLKDLLCGNIGHCTFV